MQTFVRQRKWDERFLALAEFIAGWSKDPSTQTGAVIVDGDNRVVSMGYNGLARGVKDTPIRYSDRDLKYKIIVHCERNAIIFARQSLQGCTLYTWPFMSCATCAAMVIQAGIKRVVAPPSSNPRWQADFQLSTEMFREAGVDIQLIELVGIDNMAQIVSVATDTQYDGMHDPERVPLDVIRRRFQDDLPSFSSAMSPKRDVSFHINALCDEVERLRGELGKTSTRT